MDMNRHFAPLFPVILEVSITAIGDTVQGVSSVEGTFFITIKSIGRQKMKRKLLFFTMLCCMALSANACGTDGTHQQTAENETANDNGENENDTVVSGEGLFDLTTGENGKPPVITLSSGYTMPVLGLDSTATRRKPSKHPLQGSTSAMWT